MLQVCLISSCLTRSFADSWLPQLKLQTKKPEEWTTCFEVATELPESPYIGFSALTGDVSDAHESVLFT